jgi:hypothetical protein
MKKQGTTTPASKECSLGTPAGIRDQGSVEVLLRQALPPIGEHAGMSEDLWPAMLRRLRDEAAEKSPPIRVPWFDCVVAGGLAVLLAAFPAWIPVLLYYL